MDFLPSNFQASDEQQDHQNENVGDHDGRNDGSIEQQQKKNENDRQTMPPPAPVAPPHSQSSKPTIDDEEEEEEEVLLEDEEEEDQNVQLDDEDLTMAIGGEEEEEEDLIPRKRPKTSASSGYGSGSSRGGSSSSSSSVGVMSQEQVSRLEAERLKQLFAQFTPEQHARYSAYTRSRFPDSKIMRIMSGITNSGINKNMAIVMTGITKIYVGELVETARTVMSERGHYGPIRPEHLREAYRRLKRDGKVPRTGIIGSKELQRPTPPRVRKWTRM